MRAGGRTGTGFDRAGVLAELGRGREWSRRRATDEIRRTRLEEAVGIIDEDAALTEVVVLEDRLPVVHLRARHPQLGRLRHDVGAVMLRRPRVQDGFPLCAPFRATTERSEIRVIEQIGPFDHEQQALEHVRRIGVEADPSVPGRLDRGRFEIASHGGQGRTTRHVMGQIAESRRRDGIDLRDREIEMVALARSASEPDRAERRRRGIAGRGPVADATAALDGRLVGAPAIQDRSRFGLDRELGCRAISQGDRDEAAKQLANCSDLRRNRQARLQMRIGKLAEAEENASQAVKNGVGQVEPLATCVEVLFECGKLRRLVLGHHSSIEIAGYKGGNTRKCRVRAAGQALRGFPAWRRQRRDGEPAARSRFPP